MLALRLLQQTVSGFGEHRCGTLAASLAYYTLFSLPPLLFLLVFTLTTSIGWYYGGDEAEAKAFTMVERQISNMIGNQAAEDEIGKIMRSSANVGDGGWKALIGLVGILFGATGVVASLQSSLNLVWGIKADPEVSSWKTFATKRLLSFGMILGLGFVLVVSFVISGVLESLTQMVGNSIGFNAELGSAINQLVSFLVITVTFAAIFRFMPDAKIRWRDVWVGAAFTSVLFLLGRLALSIYLSYSDPGEQLGAAAGSLAVILVWVYYSAMIVLLGAEFTRVWVTHSGRRLTPEPGAIRFVEQTVAEDEPSEIG
ncbi:membrane protein [Rhodopirellula rubra]|uniref:Membrane protein n=1 Tax=Aporhodopirellula rubra TaxID=980271 RepID=A0A7W5E3R6_9BACT|nr:YihY/virulence factor BrkB family protein [Aporhodopirellula rubra]MBB3209224.1 membrane protein [Aporhodopirellula rubra]